MKWIGQHIVDFIARFRSDVYLEEIADGTVVDNKFLGLDSSNKIVKEAASATVTDLHSAGVDGSANQLLTDDGDGTITSEANLTYDGTNLMLVSDGVASPDITLTSTSNGADASSLVFVKQRADDTPADGDVIGTVAFQGEDDDGATQIYASMAGIAKETGSGEEGGKLSFKIASHDGEQKPGLTIEDGSAEDEIDVTIANGTASVTTIAGSLVCTADATFGGGYGYTGATISTAGVGTFNGALTTDAGLTCTGTVLINGGTTVGGRILFKEGTDNGTHYIGFHAPAALTGNTAFTLPDGDGSANQVLKTNGSAVLAWTDMSGGTVGWHGSGTRIKILHSDFIPDDGGRPAMIDDTGAGSEEFFLESYSSNKLYATVAIPTGYTATHVMIYGSAADAVEVWEHQINSKTGVSKGTGNVDTEINITDVASSATNYLFIGVANASGNEVHGGYITIAES